jgi:histidyl-tRNA synthetase
MTQRYKALRGTRDILPDAIAAWHFLEDTTRRILTLYDFHEIRTPLFESTELFARSVGEATDIVRKEMYTFERGNESMTLRPEATASVVRAFVEHSLHRTVGAGFPARFYYIGPMFRHERPQKGRQRQFHQIGVEVLGAAEPLVDAETIQMVDLLLDRLGIEDRELLLGSVGDEICRPRIREELRAWLRPRLDRLCADCRRRYEENPFRVFDCKVEEDREILAGAPELHGLLCGSCATHFDAVRTALETLGVRYRLEPRLVRGLDYYRRTVFEIVSPGLGAQNAILGGGRYDGLVEELGGPELPGFGWAMGMERAVLLIPREQVPRSRADLALIALGPEGLAACPGIAERMRAAGLAVQYPVAERPMGAQIKRAGRTGARFALFVGPDEVREDRYGLKDLDSGEQTTVAESRIVGVVGGKDG